MERYREIGLKLTPQRLAILRFLDGNKSHPSAEDIYKEVRKTFPTMSFATVYNTLEALRKRGGVLELTIDPGRRRYDPNTEHHHHLICLRCKRIVDIHTDYHLDVPVQQKGSFRVLNNHIEFYGLCEECQKKEVISMAVFKCDKCGTTKEGRCKPKKCPNCGETGTMQKQG